MRVLIDYRPALRSRTGAGEYTHELAAALLARAAGRPDRPLDVTLFSSSWADRLQPGEELRDAARVDRRIPVSVLNLLWHRFEWPRAETMTGQTFDVVHSSHPLLMPAGRAAQVITIHDLDFLAHPERTRAEIRRDYPSLVRSHARRADAIIVPSHFTADCVERQLGVPRDRMAICPPGAPAWRPRPAAPRHGYLLFFSTLEPRKNVGVLLDAYAHLLAAGAQPPPLVLAGQARPEAASWLARLSAPPLAGHVSHRGYIDPGEREALYAGARLLVLPSLDEGFGMTALEAMTAGVPVVAADRGSLPEVLGGAGVLVNPLDAGELADGMRRVYLDADLAQACTERGIARAATYRWSETAERVYDTYRAAVARKAGGGR